MRSCELGVEKVEALPQFPEKVQSRCKTVKKKKEKKEKECSVLMFCIVKPLKTDLYHSSITKASNSTQGMNQCCL